jgi:hypothetical protein
MINLGYVALGQDGGWLVEVEQSMADGGLEDGSGDVRADHRVRLWIMGRASGGGVQVDGCQSRSIGMTWTRSEWV